MRTHFEYLKLLAYHALRHADTSSNWMTVFGVLLLAVGLGGLVNGLADLVPGGGIYTLLGFVGLYIVGKSVWDADQLALANLRAEAAQMTADAFSPPAALAALTEFAVTLNGHQTNYAEVLMCCWQKLAQGATEAVIEHELDRWFPRLEGQEQYYLIAEPELDLFFGQLRLLGVVDIITVRVPPDGRLRVGPLFRSNREPREMLGPTDERRYILTQFGLRMVKLIIDAPVADGDGSRSSRAPASLHGA